MHPHDADPMPQPQPQPQLRLSPGINMGGPIRVHWMTSTGCGFALTFCLLLPLY